MIYTGTSPIRMAYLGGHAPGFKEIRAGAQRIWPKANVHDDYSYTGTHTMEQQQTLNSQPFTVWQCCINSTGPAGARGSTCGNSAYFYDNLNGWFGGGCSFAAGAQNRVVHVGVSLRYKSTRDRATKAVCALVVAAPYPNNWVSYVEQDVLITASPTSFTALHYSFTVPLPDTAGLYIKPMLFKGILPEFTATETYRCSLAYA